jgi:hypothetical protein
LIVFDRQLVELKLFVAQRLMLVQEEHCSADLAPNEHFDSIAE